MKLSSSPWYIYIILCSDSTYYTGITDDIHKRIDIHNLGKGAKYTRGRLPVTLKYSEKLANKSEALKREFDVKKLSRTQKEILIKSFT